ncbi:glucan endo-1,3-beta-glucosidase [Physcomitrium patens]|uniref:Glucan endo-1,3-beta-D-glucosidase n=1 Tax=Physcomitrium patens TaxID=3218 RepID=A9RSU6_PHYPA|nr:lichenase-2-like [Physcomitrium patens]PNR35814.1 hypothetical protein PHYPA_021664 [Physcomitrium patens]|eukprot:XP_024400251.1 lichenase-2-like [Physcomitrella patens]
MGSVEVGSDVPDLHYGGGKGSEKHRDRCPTTVGICYGRVADNLPSPPEVVSLLRSRGVTDVKIYDAAGDILRAFENSGIILSVAVPNEEVAGIADSQVMANSWVEKNIRPYPQTKIGSLGVGNEFLSDGRNDASKLVPAMNNIQQALESAGLNHIKVSTPLAFQLSVSYPPSAGQFADKDLSVVSGILDFVRRKNSVFMMNIYPFFAYRFDSVNIDINYALFNPNAPTINDSGRAYRNLFDAQVDSVYAAMSRLGYANTPLMITETGWASDGGGVGASLLNAKTYNNNLVQHVLRNGTPVRPNVKIQTFIFALFNENQKQGYPIEKNFGLYYPDKRPVYDIRLQA